MSRGSAAQPGPDDDLTEFPTKELPHGHTVYRSVGTDPVTGVPRNFGWFSSGGDGRFNLEDPRGTLYVANSIRTAVLERIGPETATAASGDPFPVGTPTRSVGGQRQMDESSAERVFIRTLRVETSRQLIADLHHENASMKFSVTGELGDGANIYGISQEWASALDKNGFDGISYHTRFDTRRTDDALGWALFGSAGEGGGGLDEHAKPICLTKVADELGLKLISRTVPTRTVSALRKGRNGGTKARYFQ